MCRLPVAALTCALIVTVVPAMQSAAVAPVVRTVYVTVVGDRGTPVTNLTAQDFTVKEGNRDCAVVSAEPAREKMRLALMLEDPLAGQPILRAGLMGFVTRMRSTAEISLIVIRQRGETVVDYTSDENALAAGISGLQLSRQGGVVAAAIDDIGRLFERSKPARPVIVLVVLEQVQPSGVDAQSVMDQIARSRAQLFAVSVDAGFGQGTSVASGSQLVADGPRESGGQTIRTLTLAPVGEALQRIADDLTSQYLITYALPDGVKPSDRLSVTLKAKGVTLRAPRRISKK